VEIVTIISTILKHIAASLSERIGMHALIPDPLTPPSGAASKQGIRA